MVSRTVSMHPARKRKLQWLITLLMILGVVVALILYALRQNISLFYSPSQIKAGLAPKQRPIRVGGMVVKGSVMRNSTDLSVRFQLTDYHQIITVYYRGILPDLFREGQGIVAQGQLQNDNQFKANQVLAKHDEKYMPPEVRSTLASQAR